MNEYAGRQRILGLAVGVLLLFSAWPATAGQPLAPGQQIEPGTVRQLDPVKDPATGNTTTGTVKITAPDAQTTVTNTITSTVTPAGTEVSHSEVTVTVVKSASGTIKTTTSTVKNASGDEITEEFSEGFDNNGNRFSGARAVVKVDAKNKTRTTTIFNWDPKTNKWVQAGTPKVETIAMAIHPAVYLPETASQGSVVTGTVETQVNEAAAGTVIVTAPNGAQHAALAGTRGHFLLPGDWVVVGARLIIKDELGNIIANALLNVLAGASGDAGAPLIDRVPALLPQGGIGRITGSHLCAQAAPTSPSVLLRTLHTADIVPALASSDREVEFRVPRTIPPGPGALAVENGSAQFSDTRPTNPVKITVTTPPRVSIGQAFDAAIQVDGLTLENRQKPITATIVVSGNATFVGGQRETRIPIRDGAARVPVVAQGPGGYEVRVTGITI